MIQRSTLSWPLHWLVGRLLPFVSPSLAAFWTNGAERTRDLWLANGTKDNAIYRLMEEWQEKGYDVLLCPAFSFPAPPPDYPAWLLPSTFQ